MIKYADKLYDLLFSEFKQYGYFDVIKIYEEPPYFNIHIITQDSRNLTAVYYYTRNENHPYELIKVEEGFVKQMNKYQDRLTTREKMWLKRDFDDDAYKCYSIMKNYDDFSHLLYSLDECGGYYSLKISISSDINNELRKLVRCSRLDLSLENLALQKKYQPLFTQKELMRCYRRLDYFMKTQTQMVSSMQQNMQMYG
ncbi:MAG: hypothetical protein KAQ68_04075 [Clostridiales bacterium]|nr:hypothetical protein [Clostridiales bacterium]